MKISIVTPCFNAEKYISDTIESVISQKGDFEVEYIVVDGLSVDATKSILYRYKSLLENGTYRIKCNKVSMHIISEQDKGMYEALEKGLKLVTGDIVAYINADDFYLPNAFVGISAIFNRAKSVQWLTGIRTVFNSLGNIVKTELPYCYRQDFVRKGIYGRDLPFIQQESSFWRKSLMDKVDLSNLSHYKYAGDYYLWHEFSKYAPLRIVSSSLAGFRSHDSNKSYDTKSYMKEFESIVSLEMSETDKVRLASDKIFWNMSNELKKSFSEQLVNGQAIFNLWGDILDYASACSLKFELEGEKKIYNKHVSVVIGSYNRFQMLKVCIEAVRSELKACDFEIIVVDGGSSDGSVEWLVTQKDIVTIIQHNRGEWEGREIKRRSWGYFMNLAFKAAQGKYVCMLSDDSLIIPGAINNGLELFEKKLRDKVNLGAVAFYFRDYPVRKEYATAVNLGNLYVNHGLYLNQALKEVGYIDEDYHFYFADTDLVLKIKQLGYDCIASDKSFVEHLFHATPELRNSNNDHRKEHDRQRLINKWAGIAYDIKDKEKYLKIVGYWDYHKEGYIDKLNTINKLEIASSK